jgi:hypothetical protein
LIRLGALALGCVLAALASELIVLVIFGEQDKWPRHVVGAPWGLRYNEPNCSYRQISPGISTWHFRFNSQGMRADRDYAYVKPAGTKRIITIGDSFTSGVGAELDQTFSSVLERELNRAGQRIEVLNTGIGGFSTAEACLYLERELLKYEPDLVVHTYCSNDPEGDIRSGLFRMEGGQLVEWHHGYVPGGRLADFLNRNWFVSFLSERSNAFEFVKYRLNNMGKKWVLEGNAKSLAAADNAPAAKKDPGARLTAAILERMYLALRVRGIPLIIQSVPDYNGPGGTSYELSEPHLSETFPLEYFKTDRPGLYFLPAKEVLAPYVDKTQLYWVCHWTPFGHELSGKALTELVLRENLLNSSPSAPLGSHSLTEVDKVASR